MKRNIFDQRKKDILSKADKSSKKRWDTKIVKLCKKINSLENYYTTSSCSGRIVLIIEQDKKERGLFIKIYHYLINFRQLKRDLDKIVSLLSDIDKKQLIKSDDLLIISEKIRASGNLIKFKQEPCILHVACKSLENAKNLYDKAKLAGWKKSGLVSFKDRIIVELNSTEKLEFPIINNDKILVGDEFLKIIVRESNRKLKKSWGKIEKLDNLM